MRDISMDPPPYPVEGVLSRRLLGWLIDAFICGALTVAAAMAVFSLGLLTFGIGWYLYGGLWLLPSAYTFLCVAFGAHATPGQRFAGLTAVRAADGGPPDETAALIYAAGFWLTLSFASPLLLVALFTRQKRCLHDIAAGLVLVRTDWLDAARDAEMASLWRSGR